MEGGPCCNTNIDVGVQYGGNHGHLQEWPALANMLSKPGYIPSVEGLAPYNNGHRIGVGPGATRSSVQRYPQVIFCWAGWPTHVIRIANACVRHQTLVMPGTAHTGVNALSCCDSAHRDAFAQAAGCLPPLPGGCGGPPAHRLRGAAGAAGQGAGGSRRHRRSSSNKKRNSSRNSSNNNSSSNSSGSRWSRRTIQGWRPTRPKRNCGSSHA